MSRSYTPSKMADPWEARTMVSRQSSRPSTQAPSSSRHSNATALRDLPGGDAMTKENMKIQAKELAEASRREKSQKSHNGSRMSGSTLRAPSVRSPHGVSASGYSRRISPPESYQPPSEPTVPQLTRADRLRRDGYSYFGSNDTRDVYVRSREKRVKGGILEIDEAWAVSNRKQGKK